MFAFDVASDAEEDMPVSEIKIQKTIERIVENILSNGDIMCNVLDIKNYDDYIYYHSINGRHDVSAARSELRNE